MFKCYFLLVWLFGMTPRFYKWFLVSTFSFDFIDCIITQPNIVDVSNNEIILN